MVLTATDLSVTIRLATVAPGWRYADLATELGMAPSSLHKAVQRARRCGLVDERLKVRRSALEELCRHGAKYAFAGHPVVSEAEAYVRAME